MCVNEVHDLSNHLSLNSFSLRPRVDNSFEHCVPQLVHFCLNSFSESIDQRFVFADYLGSRTESACANKRLSQSLQDDAHKFHYSFNGLHSHDNSDYVAADFSSTSLQSIGLEGECLSTCHIASVFPTADACAIGRRYAAANTNACDDCSVASHAVTAHMALPFGLISEGRCP